MEETQGSFSRAVGLCSLLFVAVLGAWIIHSFGNREPFADQFDLLEVGRGPVRWDNGIVSVALVKAMRIFDTSNAAFNEAVRLLALILYFLSSYALGSAFLKKPRVLPIFLAFLLVSRSPFLWNSKEVITGVLFNLAFLGLTPGVPAFLSGLLIALAGFGKPETLLFALLLLLFQCKGTPGTARKGALLLGFLCPLLLSAFLLQSKEKSSDGMERAKLSLAQHYGVLVYKHQCCLPESETGKRAELEKNDFRSEVIARRDPLIAWSHSELLEGTLLQGRRTLSEIIPGNFRVYLDFLALAFMQSMLNLLFFCPFLLILLGLRLQRAAGGENSLQPLEKVFLLSLLGFLPYFFLSFLHIRFLARIVPLALIVFLNCYQNESRPRSRALFGLLLILSFLWWAAPMIQELQGITPQKQFWWPD